MVAALLAQRAPAPIYAQAQVVSPNDITTPEAVPQTSLLPTPTPDARLASVTAYVVQEGDTLWSVSLEIGVDLEEMPCVISPDFRMDQPLVIGDALASPPAGMICHQAATGETLESVAALYGVAPASIYWDVWNQLTGVPLGARPEGSRLWARLEAGRYLRVAAHSAGEQGKQGGFLAYMLSQPLEATPYMAYATGGPQRAPVQAAVPANWPYGSGYFTWPAYGWVSQAYRQDHKAVDIAAPMGAFVMAADRGVVVRAGWNQQGYGLFVVIDHNIDYVTLYSHLKDVYVQEGDVVAQGQVIGAVGSTGNSTGPHLHFEVRDFGARINPLEVLVR